MTNSESEPKTKSKSKAIGIDLGTTYSCVGVWQNGAVEIIANDQGNRTTPSYVAFTDQERLIGESAKNQASMNPLNTVYDAKRLIGRSFSDSSVQSDKKHFSFNVVPENDKPMIEVDVKGEKKRYGPEAISAMVLQKMKAIAESYLGEEVTDAVITVPAYFNDAQKRATRDAGTIAGLNVLRIINEPTAAAVAYGLDKNNVSKGEQNILVYDLGGGTFDVSILTLDDGLFEVKSTCGNTHLGGSDFDQVISDHLLKEFIRKNKSLKKSDFNPRSLRRLRTQAEKAKRTLSASSSATIQIESFYEGIDFDATLTRARFEDLCGDFFRDTLKSVEKSLKDAKMAKSDIHEVVLVGGSTRIPKVQKILSEYFKGKTLCKSINQDEAVAYGATVQAAILNGTATGDASNILLVDVASLSMGIKEGGQFMENLIDRGTAIPCKRTKVFSTGSNGQTAVDIEVFEGERKFTAQNNQLGQFRLDGIPSAPRGVPQIEVTFDLDSDGLLTVLAKELKTGKEQSVTITNESGRLSKDDIDKMVAEAEQFAEEDEKKVQVVRAKNTYEQKIYQMKEFANAENSYSNMKDKFDGLSEEDQKEVDGFKEFLTECQTELDDRDDFTSEELVAKTSEIDTRVKKITELTGADPSEGSSDEGSSGGMPGMPGMPGGMNMDEMMKDPKIREQAEAMMKDPEKMAEMQKMMQGMGGMPGMDGAPDGELDNDDLDEPVRSPPKVEEFD